MTTNFSVWVGCLAAYNAGSLHGEWIDIDTDGDVETLTQAVQSMLERSPAANAEEWYIGDSAGFNDVQIGQYERLETIVAWAAALADIPAACVRYARGCGIDDPAKLAEFIERAHVGHYASKREYAEEHLGLDALEEQGASNETIGALVRHLDWDSYIAGEIECAGIRFEHDDDGVHVFQPV